jgi:hypothetical protein
VALKAQKPSTTAEGQQNHLRIRNLSLGEEIYFIFGCTSNMKHGILHSVEDSLVTHFPHVPPIIKKDSGHFSAISYACSDCIMLQPIGWFLAWQ